jgi:hypothetical protein
LNMQMRQHWQGQSKDGGKSIDGVEVVLPQKTRIKAKKLCQRK